MNSRGALAITLVVHLYNILCLVLLGLIAVKTNAWWVMLVAPFILQTVKVKEKDDGSE